MAETWCAGVDGCRGGWFVALLRFSDDEIETVQHQLCRPPCVADHDRLL